MRAWNAINVRVFGADLLTVHVQLGTAQAGESRRTRPDRGRTSDAPRIITTSIRDLFTGCWQPVTATESPN